MLKINFSIKIIVSLLCFFVSVSNVFSQSASVPLYHSVYPFLEKLVTFLPHHALDLHVIPIDRDQVLQILKNVKEEALPLSKADLALLKQYLAEFTDPKVGTDEHDDAERHFLRHEERDGQIFIDLYGIQRFENRRGDLVDDDTDISRTQAGVRIRAKLPPRFLLAADFSNTLERGTSDTLEVFQPGDGQPVSRSGNSSFRATSIAYGRFKFPWFELELGRNQFSWNLSPLTQLTLSRSNQPFDLVRLDSQWKRFRFIFVHTKLRSKEKKFLAAHRLEIMPFSNLLLAIGEAVIYGGRDAEFEYLNPVMLYHAAEQLLGDRDNNFFTFDFSWFPKRGVKLYGELFVDDLSLEFPIGTYFGNKLAYLAGAYWVQPFGWRTGELRAEWARVDPFVYTHETPENVYEQDGESLGAPFGPNADRYHLALSWQPHRDLKFDSRLTFQRKGQGNLFRPHLLEDGNAKGFLKGTLIKTFNLQLQIEDQIRRDIYAGIIFDWTREQNSNFVSGQTANRRQAIFTLRADF